MSLTDLPCEIFAIVRGFLDYRALARLSRTCKQINADICADGNPRTSQYAFRREMMKIIANPDNSKESEDKCEDIIAGLQEVSAYNAYCSLPDERNNGLSRKLQTILKSMRYSQFHIGKNIPDSYNSRIVDEVLSREYIIANNYENAKKSLIELALAALLAGNRYYYQLITAKLREISHQLQQNKSADPRKSRGRASHNSRKKSDSQTPGSNNLPGHIGETPPEFSEFEILASPSRLFAPENRMSLSAYNNIAGILPYETKKYLRLFTEDLCGMSDVRKCDEPALRNNALKMNQDRPISLYFIRSSSDKIPRYLTVTNFHYYDLGRELFRKHCRENPDFLFTNIFICSPFIPDVKKLSGAFPDIFNRKSIIAGIVRNAENRNLFAVLSHFLRRLPELVSREVDDVCGKVRDNAYIIYELADELVPIVAKNIIMYLSMIRPADIIRCFRYVRDHKIPVDFANSTHKYKVILLLSEFPDNLADELAGLVCDIFPPGSLPAHKHYCKQIRKKYANCPGIIAQLMSIVVESANVGYRVYE